MMTQTHSFSDFKGVIIQIIIQIVFATVETLWNDTYGKTLMFSRQKYDFKIILMSYDK